jgi:hypothetical protein
MRQSASRPNTPATRPTRTFRTVQVEQDEDRAAREQTRAIADGTRSSDGDGCSSNALLACTSMTRIATPPNSRSGGWHDVGQMLGLGDVARRADQRRAIEMRPSVSDRQCCGGGKVNFGPACPRGSKAREVPARDPATVIHVVLRRIESGWLSGRAAGRSHCSSRPRFRMDTTTTQGTK